MLQIVWKYKPNNKKYKELKLSALEQEKMERLYRHGKISQIDPAKAKNYIPAFELKGEKRRTVFDFRETNKAIVNQTVHLPTKEDIMELLQGKNWMCSIDLSAAYHSLMVKEEDSNYLCFRWKRKSWKWNVTPFGINVAVAQFQGLIEKELERIEGKIIYLDDILIAGASKLEVKRKTRLIIQRLKQLGCALNMEKSILNPTKKLKYLGLIWNLDSGKYYPPEDKWDKLKSLIKVHYRWMKKKQILKIFGKMIYYGWKISGICKQIYGKIGSVNKRSVKAIVSLSKGEIIHIKKEIHGLKKGFCFIRSIPRISTKVTTVAESASPFGLGISAGARLIMIDIEEKWEKIQNNTYKEQLAVRCAISS